MRSRDWDDFERFGNSGGRRNRFGAAKGLPAEHRSIFQGDAWSVHGLLRPAIDMAKPERFRGANLEATGHSDTLIDAGEIVRTIVGVAEALEPNRPGCE